MPYKDEWGFWRADAVEVQDEQPDYSKMKCPVCGGTLTIDDTMGDDDFTDELADEYESIVNLDAPAYYNELRSLFSYIRDAILCENDAPIPDDYDDENDDLDDCEFSVYYGPRHYYNPAGAGGYNLPRILSPAEAHQLDQDAAQRKEWEAGQRTLLEEFDYDRAPASSDRVTGKG